MKSGSQYTEPAFRMSSETGAEVFVDEPAATERPMRADARRNRERILAAARTCFAEHGLDAQVDDVAATAGVGVGTVYRHFPTKDALIEALADEHFSWLAERARAALEEPDAWTALHDFLWAAGRHKQHDQALAEVLAAAPAEVRSAVIGRTRLDAAVAALVERAQSAGAVRADAQPADVGMLMCALGHVRAMGMDWERYLRIVIDGLRATSAAPIDPARRAAG